MKTITATYLLSNLKSIVRRVEAGEHIYVTYRNKLSIILTPIVDEHTQKSEVMRIEKSLRG